MTYRIRLATADDADTLAALNAHVQDVHVRGNPSLFRPAIFEEVADWFRARLQEPGVHAWIVDVTDEPIAYALIIPRERHSSPFSVVERYHEIDQLGVIPAARRQGIARELVAHVRRESLEAGVTALVLTSWSFNAEARLAFEQLGFRPEVVRFRLEL